MNHYRVGVVTALAPEARALANRALPPRQVVSVGDGAAVWLGGMGQQAAHEAAQALVEAGATALAVFGVAGALSPHLHSGSLLCPSRIIDEHGQLYQPTPAWHAALGRHLEDAGLSARMTGSLLSLGAPLRDASAKTAMRDRHQAIAVDMESAAVAAVASERHLPFVVLRAIVDERDDDVPGELHDGIDAWGRPRPLAMLLTLARHPGLLPALPRLAARMHKATSALRAAAKATGSSLGRDPPQPC